MKIKIGLHLTIYRIEHGRSKLGPFEHGGQISEVINKGLNISTGVISNIDEIDEVKNILKRHPEAIFGFSSKQKCEAFIKNWAVLEKHGFVIRNYVAGPLYVSTDGQVLFLRP